VPSEARRERLETREPEPDPGGPTLAERAGPEAAAVTGRLFAGNFSPEVMEAFGRLVVPHYAGPRHADVPGRQFPLSPPSVDVMRAFFGGQSARYDLRRRLPEIAVPTLSATSSPPAPARPPVAIHLPPRWRTPDGNGNGTAPVSRSGAEAHPHKEHP
jgi:hypothetical protein